MGKQGRAIGLFGCIDLQDKDGRSIHQLGAPLTPTLQAFRKNLYVNGVISLFRPPLLHCCPPLVITEPELRDGFRRVSLALWSDCSWQRLSSKRLWQSCFARAISSS